MLHTTYVAALLQGVLVSLRRRRRQCSAWDQLWRNWERNEVVCVGLSNQNYLFPSFFVLLPLAQLSPARTVHSFPASLGWTAEQVVQWVLRDIVKTHNSRESPNWWWREYPLCKCNLAKWNRQFIKDKFLHRTNFKFLMDSDANLILERFHSVRSDWWLYISTTTRSWLGWV